jgi:hypothetical protein
VPHPIIVYWLVLPLPHNTESQRVRGQTRRKSVRLGEKESKMLGVPSMRVRGQLGPYFRRDIIGDIELSEELIA